MTIALTDFPDQYNKNIELRIFDAFSSVPAVWRDYFNVRPTENYIEYTAGVSGFSEVGQWRDGQDLPIDEPVDIFDSTLTQVFYGKGFKVTRKNIKYGQRRLVEGWATALGRALAQKYASTHVVPLGNAFTTTYASLGNVALISASHVSSGGQTRSNLLSSQALTPANLETIIVQGLNHTNYRGLNDPLTYTRLIIPPAMRRTAVKLLGSDGEVGTTDNDMNAHRNAMRIIVEPLLTSYSTTQWVCQAETHGLISLHGQEAQTKEPYVEQSSESLVHGISADWVCGVEFWEGIAGSQGA